MKRKLFTLSQLKRTAVALPAAALMLGQSQAGTSIGINFWGSYGGSYASGSVTATAFGLPMDDWFTTPAGDYVAAATGSMNVGSLTVNWSAPNTWASVLEGDPNAGNGPWNSPLPGNPEVLWGYLDDGNASVQAPAASVSGLASVFPNGYVLQTLAANDAAAVTFANVRVNDGVTTNTLVYSNYWTTYDWYGPVDGANQATWALSPQSAVFTSATINLQCDLKGSTGARSVLCGFILTDKPVVTRSPAGGTNNPGSAFSVSAGAIGIPPLAYQWRHAGTNLPGATSSSYSVASAAVADGGNYEVVVTNLYGVATSSVATVTIRLKPEIFTDLPAATNYIYAGFNKTLAVVAEGPALAYQWHKNGSPIAGETKSSLALAAVSALASGSYHVVVSNTYGLATSSTNVLAVLPAPDLYAAQVGLDNPIAYWPLNEAAGPDVIDYAGNGHNGTQSGALTPGTVGMFGGLRPPGFLGFSPTNTVYDFDGTSAFVACGKGASLSGKTDFSVEAWINTMSSFAGVIFQQRNGGYNGEHRLMVTAAGAVNFMVYGNSSQQFNLTTGQKVNDGVWHHVVAVRSGAAGYIYIDGFQAATGSGTLVDLDANISTFIGSDERDHNNYFAGSMAAVAIYNRALTLPALKKHYYMGRYGSLTAVPPTLAGDLTSATYYPTFTAAFSVRVDGAAPLGYKWIKNGNTVLANATTDTLLLTNVQSADSGSTYQVVITNALGAVTSSIASLTVLAAPPYEGFAYATGDLAGQSGGAGWLDAWSQSGAGGNFVATPGSNYRNPTTELVSSGGTLAMGAGGSPDFMNDRTLETYVGGPGTVYLSFIGQFINSGWEGIDLYEDSTFRLFVGQGWQNSPWGCGSFPYPEILATNKPSTTYSFLVYRFDFTPTNTQVRIYVNPPLGPEPAAADRVGSLSAFRFNRIRLKAHALSAGVFDELRLTGTWAAAVPTRTRTDAPVITTQPIAQTLYPGGTAHLKVVGDGAPTVHYQWKRGATAVGADSPDLTIPNVGAGDVGNYTVTLTNPYGTTPSASVPLSLLAAPTGYAAMVTAALPLAYWPLTETAGPNAADVWGGHDAAYLGGITYGVPGGPLSFNSVTLDGLAGTKIVAPFAADLNPPGSFTAECWINPLDLTAANRVLIQSMVNGDPGANSNDRSGWALRQNGATLQFLIGNNSTTTAGYSTTATTPAVLTAGAWQHVVAVFNSPSTNISLWVNGTKVLSLAASKELYPNFAAPILIGDRGFGGWRYSGSIGQVALYGRALSDTEVKSHALNLPLLSISRSGTGVLLTWPAGTLQQADKAAGPYTNVPGASSPWPASGGTAKFYRLKL